MPAGLLVDSCISAQAGQTKQSQRQVGSSPSGDPEAWLVSGRIEELGIGKLIVDELVVKWSEGYVQKPTMLCQQLNLDD